MSGNVVRRGLRRLVALLSVLVTAGAAIVLTAAPASAAFVFQGTFRISNGSSCLEVYGSQKGDRVPVIQGPCDSGANQRWSIYLLTDQNNYQFNAFGGEQPLNQCMDGPDGSQYIHTFGCHGGHQQRWNLSINTSFSQPIRQSGTNECIGILTDPFTGVQFAAQLNCAAASTWRLIPA